MRRIRRHLSFANVVSVIALFVAISGGTAVALNGSNTVQSDDLGPGAQVKAPDVAAGSVGSPAVINESLTGQDVKNQSGVDTCTHGHRPARPALHEGAERSPQLVRCGDPLRKPLIFACRRSARAWSWQRPMTCRMSTPISISGPKTATRPVAARRR